MALRNIVIKGDEILRKKCKKVDIVDDRIKMILGDMLETMREKRGVGLAAPQIGIMRRMFVMEPEPEKIYYFINPEIVSESGTQACEEGCLSVPGMIGTVERPQKITIRGLNENGEDVKFEFDDFCANIACHENDHLDGILFIDKAENLRLLESEEDKSSDL